MSERIKDFDGLKTAIRAADSSEARTGIIVRAKTLGHEDLVPDNWSADGSLRKARGTEKRDTANDVFAALSGAVSDTVGENYYAWVQDWYGAGEDGNPYTVVYYSRGDLWAAPFSYDDDAKIVLGEGVKVRPVTSYVERKADASLEARRQRAEMLDGIREVRRFHADNIEIRETTDGMLRFSGYASVTERAYDVGDFQETIARGAFKRTLSEKPDVVFLINHGEGGGLPLARTKSGTMTLTEDARGLRVDADLNPNDPDVRSLVPKLERGDVDEMSFAFRVTDQAWSEDRSERTIRSVTIHKGDCSIVTYGANDASTGGLVTMLSALDDLEERAGKTLSAKTRGELEAIKGAITNLLDPEPESSDDGEAEAERAAEPVATVVSIPDHTTRARERIAQLRRAS